ncbi:MAG: 30S ribosomal protein S8 [Candidatus Hydrogenedentes bacterium]|nr:30S ribosomal protein S8 [Candidatus Hydrogenedentota bacterium]
MAMSDPIADLLTRIRNGISAKHERVDVPASRLKEQICAVLLQEGYIGGYKTVEDGKQNVIQVTLKYLSDRQPVVKGIRRVSRPSLRVYVGSGEIRPVRSGLGISILSTSQGVMTGKQARASKVGGEVLCEIW